MDPALAGRLSPDHVRRLAWFEQHAGEITSRPEPLTDPRLPLAHPRRGIFKPRGERYAVSVIAMLESPYPGDRLDRHDDGSWDMVYHQENPQPGRPGEVYTNAGLQACLDDQVPIGVLQERRIPGQGRRFEVLGLAVPAVRRTGYFILRSAGSVHGGTGRALMDVLVCAAIQRDDGGVAGGEDAGACEGPARGVLAGPWCAWWRLGGQSAVTSLAAVRAADSSTMALRVA
jgi:hypothetical protein